MVKVVGEASQRHLIIPSMSICSGERAPEIADIHRLPCASWIVRRGTLIGLDSQARSLELCIYIDCERNGDVEHDLAGVTRFPLGARIVGVERMPKA